jgi:hypothetical protein
MVQKGICSNCVEDMKCNFPRKFPVWECEGYNIFEPKTKITRKVKVNKRK